MNNGKKHLKIHDDAEKNQNILIGEILNMQVELLFNSVDNLQRYRKASYQTGTLWQADNRGPRLTG